MKGRKGDQFEPKKGNVAQKRYLRGTATTENMQKQQNQAEERERMQNKEQETAVSRTSAIENNT